jgi:spermidine synthase
VLFIIGFVSILGQVVILRELNVAFFGTELVYILAMGLWLLCTAGGAVIGRRACTPSDTTIRWLILLAALVLPVDVVLVRSLRVLQGGIPGTYLPFGRQLLSVLLILAPIGIILGLLFQWTAKRFVADHKTLASAYAIESAGGVLGGLVATLLLKYGVQNFATAVLCGLSAVGAILLPLRLLPRLTRSTAIAVFALLVVVLIVSSDIDQDLTRIDHPDLVATRDSPYGRVTITREADQFIVFENDALAFETQGTAAEELVHVAALQRKNAKRVLILGGGLSGILRDILKHSPETADYVELNPVLLDLCRRYLPTEYLKPLESRIVRVHIADPREFVERGTIYDLILVGMPDPTSGLSNRFYTREFFERCAKSLGADGILAFRLTTSQNIWTRSVARRNASIYSALRSVFLDATVLPGRANVVIASMDTLTRDPAILGEELQKRRIATKLVTPQYIHYLYTNDRFFDMASRLVSVSVSPNSDVEPICYRYASMIWLSKFIPAMINWDAGSARVSLQSRATIWGVIALVVCAAFLMIRRRPKLARVGLVAVAGFLGMVLESGLMLHYQVKSGVLYQNVGLLLTAFMAGLTLGSLVILRMAGTTAGGLWSIHRRVGYRLLGGFALVCGSFIALMSLKYPADFFISFLLLLITGFLVSGVFAYASLRGVDEQQTVVSPLYAADLAGGFAGALLGGLLLIPFLGLLESAVVMLALALAAVLLI